MGRIRITVISLFMTVALVLGKEIQETDNLAVEQRGVPAIISLPPAPGLRFRQRPYIQPNNDIANDYVGNLLPLQPQISMGQIIGLNVGCFPERMVVSILFDQPFNGIIYSKGFYGVPECNYLHPNTGSREVQFEIHGKGCGLQFIDPPGQQAYLESVIIIQNEPGIQEIWDTARGLRCMFDPRTDWDKQTVSAALNVAMLEQQVVTFASDIQASASMDIQIGRGPYAPSASGLVKIGELMTMVVSVEGPPEIDLHIRRCIAHDGTNDNTIDLTDQNGCVLKKKIIGSWQKQRGGNPPALAFAHFQAFKFPDKMDVFIECEVDLCSGGCPVCHEDQTNFHLRKRRALPRYSAPGETIPQFEEAADEAELLDRLNAASPNAVGDILNKTENAALRLARRLRVLSPEDISVNGDEFSTFTIVARSPGAHSDDDVCMSLVSFVVGIVVMLVVLVASSVLTAVLCVRVRTIPSSASSFPPDSSFHAFSTVSGKNT